MSCWRRGLLVRGLRADLVSMKSFCLETEELGGWRQEDVWGEGRRNTQALGVCAAGVSFGDGWAMESRVSAEGE